MQTPFCIIVMIVSFSRVYRRSSQAYRLPSIIVRLVKLTDLSIYAFLVNLPIYAFLVKLTIYQIMHSSQAYRFTDLCFSSQAYNQLLDMKLRHMQKEALP
jgi:hypothetical protein